MLKTRGESLLRDSRPANNSSLLLQSSRESSNDNYSEDEASTNKPSKPKADDKGMVHGLAGLDADRLDREKFYENAFEISLSMQTLGMLECRDLVLSQHDSGSEAYKKYAAEVNEELRILSIHMWFQKSDLEEFRTYCGSSLNDAFSFTKEECLGLTAAVSSAGVAYCDEYCTGAIDDLQFILTEHNVCLDLAYNASLLLMSPYDSFDCSLLDPVEDNSDVFPERANVMARCKSCVQDDCTGKTTKRAAAYKGNVWGAGATDLENWDLTGAFADIPGAYKRDIQEGPINLENYAQAADLKMSSRAG